MPDGTRRDILPDQATKEDTGNVGEQLQDMVDKLSMLERGPQTSQGPNTGVHQYHTKASRKKKVRRKIAKASRKANRR